MLEITRYKKFLTIAGTSLGLLISQELVAQNGVTCNWPTGAPGDPEAGTIGYNWASGSDYCGGGTVNLGSAGGSPTPSGTVSWKWMTKSTYDNQSGLGYTICGMSWSYLGSGNSVSVSVSSDRMYVRYAENSSGTVEDWSAPIYIPYYQKPSLTNEPSGTITRCSGNVYDYNPTFSGSGDKVDVYYDSNNDGVWEHDGLVTNYSKTWYVGTPKNIPYRMRAWNDDGCYGDWEYFTLTVYPDVQNLTASGSFSTGNQQCGNGTYTLSITNAGYANPVQWLYMTKSNWDNRGNNTIEQLYDDGEWIGTSSTPSVFSDLVFVGRDEGCPKFSNPVFVDYGTVPGINNKPTGNYEVCSGDSWSWNIGHYTGGADKFEVRENGGLIQTVTGTSFSKTFTNTGSSDNVLNYSFTPRKSDNIDVCDIVAVNFTITVSPEPAMNSNLLYRFVEGGNCGGGRLELSLDGTDYVGTLKYQWKRAADYDDPNVNWTTINPGVQVDIDESTYYRARANIYGCGNDKSEEVLVEYIPFTTPQGFQPIPTTDSLMEVFGPGNVTMHVNGGIRYNWYDNSGNLLKASDYGETTYTRYFDTDKTFQIRGLEGNCEYPTDVQLDVKVYPKPQLSLTGSNFLGEGTITLNLSGTTGLTTTWYKDNESIGDQGASYTVTQTGIYKVIATAPGGATYETQSIQVFEWSNQPNDANNDDQTITETAPGPNTTPLDLNHVRTFVPQIAVTEANEDTLTLGATLDENEVSVATAYSDGLGRPVQSVARRASPGAKDLISQVVYDELGRQPRSYMPYAATQTTGDHQPNALREQYDFYQATGDNIANAQNPYSSNRYEESPIGRILEQAAPGEAWYPGVDWNENDRKTVKLSQRSNQQDQDGSIVIWEIENGALKSNGDVYADNELLVTESRNEHDVLTLQFTTKVGQSILTRVQGDKNDWLDTYYVYDDFGNLTYVVPPEANRKLTPGTPIVIVEISETAKRLGADTTFSTTPSPAAYYFDPDVKVTLASGFSFDATGGTRFSVEGNTIATELHADFIYVYQYDDRQRLIARKVPGAFWEYMVYDQWDRVVLSQTGEQRKTEQWSFVKYDSDNRPVIGGLVTLAGEDLATIRIKADTASERYVTKDVAQPMGYYLNGTGGLVYPTIVENDLLSVSYFDDYTITDSWGAYYTFYDEDSVGGIYPDSIHTNVLGLPTGGATRLLGSTDWLESVIFYDHKYRPIQSAGENILGGVDRVTNVYDYAGRLTQSLQTHDPLDIALDDVLETRYFDYDHASRVNWIEHEITVGTQVYPRTRMAEYDYNELGQVIEKNLHMIDSGVYRQSVDFQYNIRGWLTQINDPGLTAEPDDLFGMQLLYESGQDQLAFDGNISGVRWQTSVGGKQRTYGYVYDPMSRLKMADYRAGTGWLEEQGNHEVRIREYDLNGNIKSLERQGQTSAGGAIGLMDSLNYAYRGNLLKSVGDTGNNAFGFKDGSTSQEEYTYDVNGNMLSDKNKGIDSIAYNHLNLPTTVILSGSQESRVEYTYDASGAKLKQELYVDSVLTSTQYYVGSYIYQQDSTNDKTLSLIQTEEGRIVPWTTTDYTGYEYQYHLTDHLGNVRLTMAGNNVSTVEATMEDSPTANADFEESVFRNVSSTRQQVTTGLNHTSGGDDAAYLQAGASELIGPAITFEVNQGDKVAITAFAKFADQASFSTTVLGGMANALANAYVGLNGLETIPSATDVFSDAFTAIPSYGSGQSNVPRAFLNYLLFDENHDLDKYGFIQVDAASGFDEATPGDEANVSWHDMYFTEDGGATRDVSVDKKGFIYIYVSNETTGAKVWFDDLEVVHTENEVVQADDYYPFGLRMAATGYQGANRLKNDYLFNSASEYEETLDWYHTPFRKYDAALGRFHGIDALAATTPWLSTGQFGFNNPISFIDPTGLTGETSDHHEEDPIDSNGGAGFDPSFSGYYGAFEYAVNGGGYGGGATSDGGGAGAPGYGGAHGVAGSITNSQLGSSIINAGNLTYTTAAMGLGVETESLTDEEFKANFTIMGGQGGNYNNGTLTWYATEGQAYAAPSGNFAGFISVTPHQVSFDNPTFDSETFSLSPFDPNYYGKTPMERATSGQFWSDWFFGEGGFTPDPNQINAVVPDLPIGPGGAVKVIKQAKNVKKIIVIGEDMANRVIPYAQKIGAKWFKPRSTNAANWMRNQVQWIRRQLKDPNTTIIDVGPKGSVPTSKYYMKELEMIKKWLGG